MKTVKTFSTELEANSARIALEAAGILAVVVGIGASMTRIQSLPRNQYQKLRVCSAA
jgi:hypothetical protein